MKIAGVTAAVPAAAAIVITHSPLAMYALGVVTLILLSGVVMPAVWSRKPARRKAATTVLQLLLHAGRRPPAPRRWPRSRSSPAATPCSANSVERQRCRRAAVNCRRPPW
jgi:hypothetical protein